MNGLSKSLVRKGIKAARSQQSQPMSASQRNRLVRDLAADFVAESQSLETNAQPIDRQTVLATEPDKQ
jgi:hypothetical protein